MPDSVRVNYYSLVYKTLFLMKEDIYNILSMNDKEIKFINSHKEINLNSILISRTRKEKELINKLELMSQPLQKYSALINIYIGRNPESDNNIEMVIRYENKYIISCSMHNDIIETDYGPLDSLNEDWASLNSLESSSSPYSNMNKSLVDFVEGQYEQLRKN